MSTQAIHQRTAHRAIVIAIGIVLAMSQAAIASAHGACDNVALAPYAGSANQRSVALVESREAPVATAAYDVPVASVPSGSTF